MSPACSSSSTCFASNFACATDAASESVIHFIASSDPSTASRIVVGAGPALAFDARVCSAAERFRARYSRARRAAAARFCSSVGMITSGA